MNKREKMFVVVMAVMIQVIISVLYGFSKVPVPSGVCLLIWCICAVMICKIMEVPEIV